MNYRISLTLGLLALALLIGCASTGRERDINDPTNSLVLGYIDMSEAPTGVKSAWIRQIAPPSDEPFWSFGISDGLFYNSFLPLGSYQMSSFGGSGFFAGEHRYNFPRQDNQTAMRITKPGIYFIGSYKFRKVKTGIFEQGRFLIEKIDKPTEAELLKRLLDESDEIKNSSWANKIRARLAQLKS